ncbi:MAG: hypothetical protein JNL12_07325 [Planctomycetes bacterium]|nr:hypothetical protein [Planctomycetota bacterium]
MTKKKREGATKSATLLELVRAFRTALRDYWESPLFDEGGPDGPEASAGYQVREDDYPRVSKAVLKLASAARDLAKAVANTHDVRPLVQLARHLEHGAGVLERGAADCYAGTEAAEVLVEALELGEEVTPQAETVTLDVVADPGCKSLRDTLRKGPKKLAAIEKDTRCPSRRRASDLLKAMALRGMVAQTKTRGPWRFVSDTPTK